MVFTVALATKFFCAPNQMGLANNVRVALVGEGIVSVNNLAEFHKNHWHQVVTKLKYPASFLYPENDGQYIWAPTITLVAKSLERLKVASEAARYYEATGRPPDSGKHELYYYLANLQATVEVFVWPQWWPPPVHPQDHK